MPTLAEAATTAPREPGVYFFLAPDTEILYIGKATSLRQRLQQHLKAGLEGIDSRATRRLEAADVRWEVTRDADAAAARESDLIVSLRPVLNASLATEGRWAFIVMTPDALTLTPSHAAAARGVSVYGCFPHLGVGVSSKSAIACSEGYSALLRLLWAAQAEPGARYPARVSGPSPPASLDLSLDDERRRSLHALLSGTSARLIGQLDAPLARHPPFMQTALVRDRERALAFYANGPVALRRLRLRHGLKPKPLSRAELEGLFFADVTAAIGPVRRPQVDDPTGGLLGARFGRAVAMRARRAADSTATSRPAD